MIGWIDGNDVYLDPIKSIAAVQRVARDLGESIPVSQRTLIKRIVMAGIGIREPSQESNLHRLPAPRHSTRGIRLRPGVLWDPAESGDVLPAARGLATHLCPASGSARPVIGNLAQTTSRPCKLPSL